MLKDKTCVRKKYSPGYYNFLVFKRRLFDTTEIELRAIAAPAIIGFKRKPLIGYNIPAAIGIPMRL